MRRKRSAAAPSSNEFFLPRDVFKLELKQGLLLAYICLQYQKGVQSSQCWPGCATIGAAVGMPRKTVQRHVCALVDKGLAVTENTSVFSHGLKINGNLRCTLKPILQVLKERKDEILIELKLAETQRKWSEKLSPPLPIPVPPMEKCTTL